MHYFEVDMPVFWLLCENDTCYCDWRIRLKDCEFDDVIRSIFIAGCVYSSIISLTGLYIFYHRIRYRGQQVFTYCIQTGFIRPRPVDCMLLLLLCYNILRVIQTIIVITDVAPNIIFRIFAHEFPWQFGISALSSYFFGIAHTVGDSSKTIYNEWFSNPRLIDIVCTTILLSPFITNNVLVLVTGVFAENGNMFIAEALTRTLYFLWSFYVLLSCVLIFIAGYRLLILLQKHITSRREPSTDLDHIKTSAFKVKMIVIVGCTTLGTYVLTSSLYGGFRTTIQTTRGLSMFLCILWMIVAPTTTLLIEIAIILSPRALSSLVLSDLSSREEHSLSYSESQTKVNSYSSSMMQKHIKIPGKVLSINTTSLHRQNTPNDYVFAKEVCSSDSTRPTDYFDKDNLSSPVSTTTDTPVKPYFSSKPRNPPVDHLMYSKINATLHSPTKDANKWTKSPYYLPDNE
ncbi:hypothetical protein BDF14DRAFT_1748895 [Spinellus fusiger]|nr:hypothetical protein BDF14DRAFT_1748895 [Spinellus fusiger]